MLAPPCGLDPQAEPFDEDELYEAMDALNGRWVGIEKALYGPACPERVSLVLYDLTSVYFEGKGPAGFGTYGYSRDHRPERPQPVFVFDGGMSSRLNLEALQEEHLPFVTRLSAASLPEVLARIRSG